MQKLAGIIVLLVDDEEVDRSNTATALMLQGYTVLEATNYCQAMAVFDLNRNDIAFLIADVALPDGDGCALAVAMRNQKPDLGVLFTSYYSGATICQYYGLIVPDLHFLKKPFTKGKLVKRVGQILSSTELFPRLGKPKTRTASGELL